MIMRLMLMCFFMVIGSTSMAASLTSLQVQDNGGKTAIICTFSGPYKYKIFLLRYPSRVVVDLEHTTTAINVKNLPFNHGLITSMRSGHPDAHTLRLVFDVRSSLTFRSTSWQPASRNLRGLRIDLVKNNGIVQATVVKAAAPSLQHGWGPVQRAPDRALNSRSSRSLRDVIVVIDPGHGGKDPGAIGMGRSAEKQVVLAIAIKLKQLIDRQPGMHAVLTRNGDYYIGLRERMTIARRDNADIFIAIHADAFNNPNSNGASVFALSARGATSEAARWLAEKENHSEWRGVNMAGLDDQNGILRTVLFDMTQTETIRASLQMGSQVLRGLDTITRLHNNKVEQARFVVLKSPDIPSILIETGFISNRREEQNLTNPAYQTRLTQAIFQGLKDYFMHNPPHGTRLEAMAAS